MQIANTIKCFWNLKHFDKKTPLLRDKINGSTYQTIDWACFFFCKFTKETLWETNYFYPYNHPLILKFFILMQQIEITMFSSAQSLITFPLNMFLTFKIIMIFFIMTDENVPQSSSSSSSSSSCYIVTILGARVRFHHVMFFIIISEQG